MYNWQQRDWPNFKYIITSIEAQLYDFAEKSGRLNGVLTVLPKDNQIQTTIDILVTEALKTSEIEREYLSLEDLISSIKNNLGFQIDTTIKDKNAQRIANLIIDVQNTYSEALTQDKLFAWHKMIFSAETAIHFGQWRTHADLVQVMSVSIDRPTVHFEAPTSANAPIEMDGSISWFNSTAPDPS